jgi:hypothetical protein
MSRRLQFGLRVLLVLSLAVACFLGGMALQARIDAKRRADAEEWFADTVLQAIERGGANRQIRVGRELTGVSGDIMNDLPGNR